MLFKRKRIPFPIPNDARALTSNVPLNVPTTTTNTEPKYEPTYYNQMVEKLKVQAAKDGNIFDVEKDILKISVEKNPVN